MTEQYDVAILGAGFEGSLLGTILAYQGAKVVILDAGTHPRFALGESTVRHTFRMLKIIAERFGVPELKEKFYSAEHLHKHVSGGFGVKKNFGFILHHEGQHQNPEEATQFVIPPYREGHEAHLYRQDTDAFLTYTAIHHGATVKYSTRVKEVEAHKDGVVIKSEKNETFRARFVADASGGGHVLSRMWDLRDNPPRVKLQTRCLFTHMIDVKPYDDLDLPNGVPKAPHRWYEGTCHHIFDGGWVWVIPFNNRPNSTNPVISVGVSFDIRKFPKPTDITPQEEWMQFLDKFPSVKEQFKDAKPVRDWVSSDRLQTSCKQTVGDRWALMAGGAGSGFFDALFSRGLAGSMEVTHALAARILKGLKEDDLSAGQFEYVSRLHENLLQNNDKLVRSAYTSFRDFDLWNAWFRVWVLGVGLGDLKLASTYRRYLKTHDDSLLPDAEEPMGLFFSQHKGFQVLFDAAVAKMDEVEEGRTNPKAAAKYIFQLIQDSKFTPAAHKLGDPASQVINSGTRMTELKTLFWLFTSAPSDIRDMSLGLLGLGKAPSSGSVGNAILTSLHGDKGVLVTGASRGLGLETALTLAQAGFRVWAGVRDSASAETMVESARKRGVTIEPVQLEVTDQASVDSAFEKIARDSCPLYGLVNNAGITARAYFEDFPEERIRKTFEVNVFGTMRVTRRALPLLRKAGRSRIVMISSIGGRIGSMSVSPYVSSKFAVEGFSESLALEVKPFGVDIVIVEPGMVKTEIWDEERRILPEARDPKSPYYPMFWKAEAETEKALENSGLRPEDVAQCILRVMTHTSAEVALRCGAQGKRGCGIVPARPWL